MEVSMYNFFGGSLVKALATIFLFVVCMMAVCVYAYEILNGLPINDIVRTILDFAISFSLTILGVNHGQVSANETFDKIMSVSPDPTPR